MPESAEPIPLFREKKSKKIQCTDVLTHIKNSKQEVNYFYFAPVTIDKDKELTTVINILKQQGFSRLMSKG